MTVNAAYDYVWGRDENGQLIAILFEVSLTESGDTKCKMILSMHEANTVDCIHKRPNFLSKDMACEQLAEHLFDELEALEKLKSELVTTLAAVNRFSRQRGTEEE